MADIATFTSRDSVVHAAIQALEKEGIGITLPSPKNASLPDTEEVSVLKVSHFKQGCSSLYIYYILMFNT